MKQVFWLLLWAVFLGGCTREDAPAPKDAPAPSVAPIIHDDLAYQKTTHAVDIKRLPMGAPIDVRAFDYPFDLNGEPVKKYAKAYGITNEQAQHSLVLGMASNEALSALLDQIGTHYISHALNDGADMALIITVDDGFETAQFDYVLKDFGAGLKLPVRIVHAKKS